VYFSTDETSEKFGRADGGRVSWTCFVLCQFNVDFHCVSFYILRVLFLNKGCVDLQAGSWKTRANVQFEEQSIHH